ncbi:MAG TPA: hypothetical protein VM759_01585, partial [Longimicrobium sp.]|nr:hypothetical protein [Longimicrobium sp.]
MTPERLRGLLADVASGALAVEDAERRLAWAPVEDLDFARVDHHRALRQGFPEVVFGEGKTPEQIVAIAERIVARGDGFLATRVAPEAQDALRASQPAIQLNTIGRTAWLPAVTISTVPRAFRGSGAAAGS